LAQRLDQRDQRIWEAIDGLRDAVAGMPHYQQPCETMKDHLSEQEKRADRWWQLALKLIIPALAGAAGALAMYK
jgi:hypothetical protein